MKIANQDVFALEAVPPVVAQEEVDCKFAVKNCSSHDACLPGNLRRSSVDESLWL